MAGRVLEHTPNRLIVEFGYKLASVTVCTFDKTTGRARFDNRTFLWRRKPVDVPLSDVTSIDVTVQKAGKQTFHHASVNFHSREKLALPPASSPDLTRQLAAQMREFLGLPAPPPGTEDLQHYGGKVGKWYFKILSWIVVVLALLIGAVQLLSIFALPDCDSKRIRDTVTKIFTDRKIEVLELSEIKTLNSTSSEINCQARVRTATENAIIDYRVDWNGWTPQVRIVKVTNR